MVTLFTSIFDVTWVTFDQVDWAQRKRHTYPCSDNFCGYRKLPHAKNKKESYFSRLKEVTATIVRVYS